MDEQWAKALAEKITLGNPSLLSDERATRIVKFAEKAREEASDLLFNLFIERLEAVEHYLQQAQNRGGFFQRWRNRTPKVLDYIVERGITLRFQTHEAWGDRLAINYQQGAHPQLIVDVALTEMIQGDYLPIFRASGAIAGAQIWQRQSAAKHPTLIARLALLLSAPAIDEGLAVREAISWVYEDQLHSFTKQAAGELIEALVAIA